MTVQMLKSFFIVDRQGYPVHSGYVRAGRNCHPPLLFLMTLSVILTDLPVSSITCWLRIVKIFPRRVSSSDDISWGAAVVNRRFIILIAAAIQITRYIGIVNKESSAFPADISPIQAAADLFQLGFIQFSDLFHNVPPKKHCPFSL